MRTELGPRSIGRIAASLFVASGALSVVTLPLPHPPGMNVGGVLAVSAVAALVGAVAFLVPWDTWPRRASLGLVPVAFGLIALGNIYGSSRPYTYSVFFVVTFVWIGMSQPRWTSVWFSPLAAVAFAAPMLVRADAERGDAAGAALAMPVCVLVAELIAWIVAGERRSRQSAQSLVRVASALGQHLDEARLHQTLVDEARRALGSEHAVLFRIDPDEMSITDVRRSAVPEPLDQILDRLRGTTVDALPPELTGGQPMAVTDSATDGPLRDVLLRHGVKSYLAVPVVARGALVGVLTCWERTRHRAYSDDDLDLARALAGQASAAIENAQLYERTLEAARCDHLTGLGNRRAFRERLESEVDRARRHRRDVSLVLVDCDGFKRVNDTLGHQAGDRVLERIGEMLVHNGRREDGAFRIGGDEFALLLPETSAAGATTLAERFRRSLERAALGAARDEPLTASLGLATSPAGALSSDDLFAAADDALYDVKATGGNATAGPPGQTVGAGHALGVDIQTVVDDGLLDALCQPIFELPSGRVIGFETFVHLDPVCGSTATATLLRAAQAAGILDAFDRVCRRVALSSARGLAWNAEIFLNVTPAALAADRPMADEICSQIDDEGLARGRVVLEVTEHERAASSRALVRNLRACQEEGVKIALDDFNAAPSDLDLLAAIRFDYVKVDMGFVHGTPDVDSRRSVLRGLCVLIRETGALPMAEGVETADDLRLVRDLGFVGAQGYLLRGPAAIPDLSPRQLAQLLTTEPVATH